MLDSEKQPLAGSTPPLILFATPPPLESLQALTVWMTNTAKQPSRFQPQVIKCREFIFTEPDIIGSPSADIKDHCFHLVAQLSLLNSGRLQTRLSRVGLEVSKPHPVTPELYQSCLRYTLQARISPTWNKAGQWLIQGRDFLTHKGCANAVKLDLTVTHNELYFTLQASALRLSPLQVTDLDIVGGSLKEYLDNTRTQIDHDCIASDWCFVLPSMKKGRIVSISRDLPEDSPFMSYRDLKRHWKNTYGYRLPETEDDMSFYQVHFGPLGGRLFTYPELCLRSRELQQVSRVDPKPILRAFMLEIQNKFPTICGVPMKLQSKARFPVSQLWESGQTEAGSQPNLTNKMAGSRSGVYRSRSEMDSLLSHTQPNTFRVTSTQPTASQVVNNHPAVGRTKLTASTPCMTATDSNPCSTLRSLSGKPVKQQSVLETQSERGSMPSYSQYGVRAASQHTATSKLGSAQTAEKTFGQRTPGSKTINASQRSSVSNTITPVQNFTSSQKMHEGVNKQSSIWTPSQNTIDTDQATASRKLYPQFKARKCLGVVANNQPSQQGPKIVPAFKQPKKLTITDTAAIADAGLQTKMLNRSAEQSQALSSQRNPSTVVPLFHKKYPQKSVDSVSCLKGAPVMGKKTDQSKAEKQGGKVPKEKKAQKRPRANKNEDKKTTKKKLMKAEA